MAILIGIMTSIIIFIILSLPVCFSVLIDNELIKNEASLFTRILIYFTFYILCNMIIMMLILLLVI